MDKIKVGIIGCGHRGWALLGTICACEEADFVAVSDAYDDRLGHAVDFVKEKRGKAPAGYKDGRELIADKNVEAVVIATPWDSHVRLAIACMRAGKIAAIDVGGAYDVQDCWDLVNCYEETGTPFMLLENCCFDRFELLTTSLYRAGKIGKAVYCHGAYAHDLRDSILGSNVIRQYRLDNYRLRNCENYPTHDLGPIAKLLGINRGNKMISVSSVASKGGVSLEEYAREGHSPDPEQVGVEFAQGDIIVTNITCAGGEVITLRLDTTLPRFYDREFTVHGTKGLCMQTANLVVMQGEEGLHEFYEPEKSVAKWLNSADKYSDYLPACWRSITEKEKALGHGGMDYIMMKSFLQAAVNKTEMPVDVYDAAAWMCITPLSEQSIAHGGMPQAIPDFTRGRWFKRPVKDVMELPDPNE